MALRIMWKLYWLFVLFSAHSTYCLANGKTVCEPAEEGAAYEIKCDLSSISGGNQHQKKWSVHYGATIVGACHPEDGSTRDMKCKQLSDKIDQITHSKDTIIVTLSNVSRTNDISGSWWCRSGDATTSLDPTEVKACNHLEVYVKPEVPVCSYGRSNSSIDKVTVTCVTGKVFPEAACHFLYSSYDKDQFSSVSSDVTYSSTMTQGYYSTECTADLQMIGAPRCGKVYVKVVMHPKLRNSSQQGAVESDLVEISEIPWRNNDVACNTSDERTHFHELMSIGLGASLVLVLLFAIVYAAMWLGERKKRRSMGVPVTKNAKTIESPSQQPSPSFQRLYVAPDIPRSRPKVYQNQCQSSKVEVKGKSGEADDGYISPVDLAEPECIYEEIHGPGLTMFGSK